MEERREAAIRFLEKNKLLHMDMLEALKHDKAYVLQVSDQGVLLRIKDTGTLLLAANEEAEAERWLREEGVSPELEELNSMAARESWDSRSMPDFAPARSRLLAIHGDTLARGLMDRLDLIMCLMCHHAVYSNNKKPGSKNSPGAHYTIRPLDESYLGLIAECYAHTEDGNSSYLPERLAAGQIYGAFYRAELMGFIGEPEEGCLGMLEILPAHRRKGVDQALCRWMAHRQMERGRVPYAQVEPGNSISFAAHRKLGFDICDEIVHWVEIPTAL